MEKEIIFDKEQQEAYDIAMSGKSMYIAGVAGVGKTCLVKKIIKDLRERGKRVEVAAPSQGAALLLDSNGVTIHGLYNTYPGGLSFDISGTNRLHKSKAMEADVVIIDEISMCGGQLFTYIYKASYLISKAKGKKIQLIVIGDFLQLPPTGDKYAFESVYWDKIGFKVVLLQTSHRQEDMEYFTHLGEIREGKNGCENVEWLKERAHYFEKKEDAPILCSYRSTVAKYNREIIEKLEGEGITYKAETDNKKLFSNMCVDDEIYLKVGAFVMTVINDPLNRYHNGSTGTIVDMSKDTVTIKFGDSATARPHVDIIRKHIWTEEYDGVIYSYEQIPIIPAYALTIHKAQGCTLDYVNINPRCFATGQLYVALSRVRSVDCLYINSELREEDIKVDVKVLEFYARIFEKRVA